MWTLLAFSGMDETCYFFDIITHFSQNMVVMTSDSATRMLFFMVAALTSFLENALF